MLFSSEPRPVCISVTCSPTSQFGGTSSHSWPLLWSAYVTCICMNSVTCGRSSFTWRWERSSLCRSTWEDRRANHLTTTSDPLNTLRLRNVAQHGNPNQFPPYLKTKELWIVKQVLQNILILFKKHLLFHIQLRSQIWNWCSCWCKRFITETS